MFAIIPIVLSVFFEREFGFDKSSINNIALIGIFIGLFLDYLLYRFFSKRDFSKFHGRLGFKSQFLKSFLKLTAGLINADEQKSQSELDFVSRYFKKEFGEKAGKKYFIKLSAILDQEVDLIYESRIICDSFYSNHKIQILHYLVGITISDKELSYSEEKTMERIAIAMGINPISLKAIYKLYRFEREPKSNTASRANHSSINIAFEIIGVSKNSSEAEIKKAYRSLVKIHHPDKLSHLSKEHIQSSKVKFQKIQEAYEMVKTHKGFN